MKKVLNQREEKKEKKKKKFHFNLQYYRSFFQLISAPPCASTSNSTLWKFKHFSVKTTEWKFKHFSATQILRKINISGWKTSKNAILTISAS